MMSQNDTTMLEYEEEMCNITDYCYDLTWTGLIKLDMYWDRAHFVPVCYNWMNVMLLKLLSTSN